ncbi:MAG: DUF5719 family protein [Actinomycetota bacterium]
MAAKHHTYTGSWHVMNAERRGRGIAFPLMLVLTLTMTVILLAVQVCLAGQRWTDNGVGVCTASDDQIDPCIAPDGSGGAFIAWEEYRWSDTDIFVQRIDASGAVHSGWAFNGQEVCSNGYGQLNPEMVSDGAGGAIIAWEDERYGTDDVEIYAQRIDPSGEMLWGGSGVAICTAADNQTGIEMIPDGSGGAILCWIDARGADQDIYAMKVNSAGAVQWTSNGVPLCTVAGDQWSNRLVSDDAGGAIVCWSDYRVPEEDIYAQRVDSSGAIQWLANGEPVCTASDYQFDPDIARDGSGGAVITWTDLRSGWDVYAQRMAADGGEEWVGNGVTVCGYASDQEAARILDCGSGNTIIAWEDDRNDVNWTDVYSQKVDSGGNPQWTAVGVPICTAAYSQHDIVMVGEGTGGAIIAWRDFRGSSLDVYTQKVSSGGSTLWNPGGAVMCDAIDDQRDQVIAADGTGEAIIAWEDARPTDSTWDIYAQRATNDPPAVGSITPSSGLNNGSVEITNLAGSYFRAGATVRLERDGQGDIDATGVTVVSQNKITCSFDLTGTAVGAWDVVVTNDDGLEGRLANGFTVEYPAPEVTGINPDTGLRGYPLNDVSITGDHFRDVAATVRIICPFQTITATDVHRVSANEITADLNLSGAEVRDDWDVYIQHNDDGKGGTLDDGFTVEFPPPDVDGIDPDTGFRDHTLNDAVITGNDFRNAGLAVELRRPGSTVTGTGVTWQGSQQISADFDLAGAPVASDWDLYVRDNDTGKEDTLADCFTVEYAPPVVNAVTPNSAENTGVADITDLAGADFRIGASARLEKAGESDINATDVNVVSPASITCRFDLAGKATGAWDVVVQNDDGKSDTLAGGFTVEYPAPTVASITPTGAENNATVNITNLAGTNFRIGATVNLLGPSQGSSGGGTIDAGQVVVVSPTRITCEFDLDGAQAGTYDVRVTNNDDKSGTCADAFVVEQHVEPVTPKRWYRAEGTTAWGFVTEINIANPNASSVRARVTYMTDTGPISGGDLSLAPLSQTTVIPSDLLGERDFSTMVECPGGETIGVDRTMTWTGPGAPAFEAHSSAALGATAKTWYLPEGSSSWGFECWLLIQNPNGKDANLLLTYMIENEGPRTFEKVVPANSRRSFNMAEDIGAKDASIKVESDLGVIPERAMYRDNRREGHGSVGTTTPATDYYLAEGSTNWGFTTYVLVQNPNNAEAEVAIEYMTTEGPIMLSAFYMPANSRKTIRVNDALPAQDFSTRVTADRPIIAERAMYWGEDSALGEACHDSIGLDSPHATFILPDGNAGPGVETWTLVQNPNGNDVIVEVSYLGTDGLISSFTDTIPANSRRSYGLAETIALSGPCGASTVVTCKTPGSKIMVERAMYWNGRGAGTDTIGVTAD